MMQAGFLFAMSLACALAVTPLVRVLAVRYGYVASPNDDRWHRHPTAFTARCRQPAAAAASGRRS